MTRINLTHPSLLCNKHLFAEYRELPRLIKNLNVSLNNRGFEGTLKVIGEEYKLGSGHVKFFFDKFKFLESRYKMLFDELVKRNFDLNYDSYYSICKSFCEIPDIFKNDYKPTYKALSLNIARINDRMPKNPKFSRIKRS